MSIANLKPRDAKPASGSTRTQPADWESPTGPVSAELHPRTAQPTFIYRGYGDEHWRGQACHLAGAARPTERMVVFSCGCQARVPWWTLEPIAPR